MSWREWSSSRACISLLRNGFSPENLGFCCCLELWGQRRRADLLRERGFPKYPPFHTKAGTNETNGRGHGVDGKGHLFVMALSLAWSVVAVGSKIETEIPSRKISSKISQNTPACAFPWNYHKHTLEIANFLAEKKHLAPFAQLHTTRRPKLKLANFSDCFAEQTEHRKTPLKSSTSLGRNFPIWLIDCMLCAVSTTWS